MDNKKIFLTVIFVLILGVIGIASVRGINDKDSKISKSGKYDTFTQCLEKKGAVFYGAFWCPHCQAQKKLFGSSVKLLPYVECSTPDASAQTRECIDKEITGYPTWEFADGSRLNGEIPLEKLAEKTGCELPE